MLHSKDMVLKKTIITLQTLKIINVEESMDRKKSKNVMNILE